LSEHLREKHLNPFGIFSAFSQFLAMAFMGIRSIFRHTHVTFTIWLFNIAMENGPFIDGLPIKNGDVACL
jgi:hypothetical protein